MDAAGGPAGPERRGKAEIRDAIVEAIRAREVLRVRYLREDSRVTERDVEPFDLAPLGPAQELALYGWCRHHGRMEARKVHRILWVRPTGEGFDPAPRLRALPSPPKFTVAREW